MKFLSIFSTFLFTSNFFGNSLCLPINKKFNYGLKPIEEINNLYFKIKNFNNQNQNQNYNNKIIKNKKFNSFLKLIRYKNIFPTIYLFLTGTWLVNPNLLEFIKTIKSLPIIYSLISTLLILTSNMVINDLFDLKIDRINHSDRPLVSGEIKIIEAILLTIALIFSTELINIFLLPQKLQIPIHLSVLFTFIYTPFLKKILFVKNISCALMVAYSVFFGAFAAYNNFNLFDINNKVKFLYQVITFVFFGSLYNEILLDVRDYEGDKKNNISTIATVFGNKNALNFCKNILFANIYGNLLYLINLNQIYYSLLFLILSIPIFSDFYLIKFDNITKNSIMNASYTLSKQLIYILILFCFLSFR
jgi:4-hydroxybenzoate polyprenyltransferase